MRTSTRNWIPARHMVALAGMTIVAGMTIALVGCAPREWLMPKLGMDPPVYRDFGEGFTPPLSAETNQPVGGFGGTGGGVHRTPIILVHGTTVSASFWKGARQHYYDAGYTGDEVWAVSYGWNNGRYFDSNELSAVTLDRFVTAVTEYLSKKTGRPIQQVDMIGHSLGNTIIRHWAKQTNSWHVVRSFVGNSGVNHGSWTLTGDPRGPNRTSAFEMYAKSPWLAALNRGGETPGPTRWMTLYDGTGWRDLFYPPPFTDSPKLEGATNVAYDAEHTTLGLGSGYGHLELATREGPVETMIQWLREGHEALPDAQPPQVRFENGVPVVANDAALHCATGIDYPTLKSAGVPDAASAGVRTCFAYSEGSGLASAMFRYVPAVAAKNSESLTLTASPAGGVFEQPQSVTLTASDPDAFIVYSTVTTHVNSGMPLYSEPVYVAAPLTLTAVAYAPDGRVSAPLTLEYDISQEYVEAVNTPERQFDPDAPIEYTGHRKVGR